METVRIQGDPEQALKTAIKLWREWRFRDIETGNEPYLEIDLTEPLVCEFCGNREAFGVEGYRIRCLADGCRGVLAAYNPKVNQWKMD